MLGNSPAVRKLIGSVRKTLTREHMDIGDVFERCFLGTLETALKMNDNGTAFVLTGDIPAMWLRDSACQMRPYLYLVKDDPRLARVIAAVIRRQVQCILTDPYANAFNESANGNCWDKNDKTKMRPELWERKFEIDSLCFPVQLAYLFWKNGGTQEIFDASFREAAEQIVTVFRTEQDHEHLSDYTFERSGCVFTDTLPRDGKGALVNPDTGMIWSGFRPSDDACMFGYLVPSNMFASVILGYLSEISKDVWKDETFAAQTASFSAQIRTAIDRCAVIQPGGERFREPFYAYEVDGFGQYLVMDDANLPSLLSMPYIGYCSASSQLYRNTRKIILSEQNPYYYKGSYAGGIGSIHTPSGYVWHLAMGVEGLVTEDPEKKKQILMQMAASDGGTGCMHESFDPEEPSRFTRPWFAWGNAIFAELVLDFCGYKLNGVQELKS